MSINNPKDLKAKDVPTQIAVDSLISTQKNTLDQLAILRQTRGQRDVGQLKVPAHLQQPFSLIDAGVQEKNTRAGGDE